MAPHDLMLVICEPVYASSVTIDPYEIHEIDDGFRLPMELEDAFDTLHEAIFACKTPIYWTPGKVVPASDAFNFIEQKVKEGSP